MGGIGENRKLLEITLNILYLRVTVSPLLPLNGERS
jgi:hypothetical protein